MLAPRQTNATMHRQNISIRCCYVGFCLQDKNKPVAIKCITKKNLAKSQSLLSKEIKILKVRHLLHLSPFSPAPCLYPVCEQTVRCTELSSPRLFLCNFIVLCGFTDGDNNVIVNLHLQSWFIFLPSSATVCSIYE